MASNNTRGNGERATSRCTDADLYGSVNVLARDGFESQVYSKEIHADAVKKGPNKLCPHKDAMSRADVIKNGSYGGMKIVHPSPAVTEDVAQK